MKKSLLLLALSCSTIVVHAQTYISGGIYANTTWTKAASPYIVTDTVVVFPGVTLKIEPGVTVKFDENQRLEIREAKLIAEGTATDSIVFTSNMTSPVAGNWSEIFLNKGVDTDTLSFNFCRIEFAQNGINSASANTVVIKNSLFQKNYKGIFTSSRNSWDYYLIIDSSKFDLNEQYGIDFDDVSIYFYILNSTLSHNRWGIRGGRPRDGKIENTLVEFNEYGIGSFQRIYNCEIANNATGVEFSTFVSGCNVHHNKIGVSAYMDDDSVINCSVHDNDTGIQVIQGAEKHFVIRNRIEDNKVGIEIIERTTGIIKQSVISCNKICNNTEYNLRNKLSFGSNAIFSNNYWCTEDSAIIAGTIFDGFDDVKYGLAKFIPVDSVCYKAAPTSIKGQQNLSIKGVQLSPNPLTNYGVLEFQYEAGKNYQLCIYNTTGQKVSESNNLKSGRFVIERNKFSDGIYFLTLSDNQGAYANMKFIVQ